jgi:hypothetical protein
MTKEHCQEVKSGLERLERTDDTILIDAVEMLKANNSEFYSFDLFAVGALKRAISLSKGFRVLIQDWNLVTARAILRLQLDTLLRFSAGWLVDNPHKFAEDVLSGKRIDKLIDKTGNKLRDNYLCAELGKKYEWIPRVYEQTSAFVHLSGRHIISALSNFNDTEMSNRITISAADDNYPNSSYIEAVDCFQETTNIFLTYIKGWTITKDTSIKR